MIKPAKHNRDHAPDSEDWAFDVLAWAIAGTDNLSQAVTETSYMHLETFLTNAPDVFDFDPDLPDRIYIREEGIYQSMLDVHSNSVDIAKQRYIYQQLSYEMVGGFGNELSPAIGTGQREASISEVTNETGLLIPKSRLTHWAHGWFLTSDAKDPNPALGPYVLQGVLGHVVGNDWAVANLNSSLTVVRLASFTNWKLSLRAS